MRQGQQNRRGRGRNNNNNNQNRKSQNPMTRSFESTGPDVKVRGTPAHIAEKYMSLARDALSSGDPVLAENYLQHAEHYNRIILTYREQQMSQGGDVNPNMPRPQSFNVQDNLDDEFGDDEASGGDEQSAQGQGAQGQGAQGQGAGQPQGMGEQPSVSPRNFEGGQQRYDSNRQNRHNGNRFDRGDRQDRGDREQRFNRQDRGDRDYREDRNPGFAEGEAGAGNGGSNGFRRRDRSAQGEPRGERQNDRQGERFSGRSARQSERGERQNDRQSGGDREPAGFAAVQGADGEHEQPAFLRRPVRRTRREEPAERAPAQGELQAERSAERQPVADEQE